MGDRKLKNIAEKIAAFRVVEGSSVARPNKIGLPEKPALAVLPFANLGGGPDQDYFADGIVDDIITALSRFRSFAVVSRNSSFVYKNRAVDIRTAAQELGVRYVLEGSVRRRGQKIRVTAQLIEADQGMHLWAEKFDGDFANLFDVQDEITESVAGIIGPEIRKVEIVRARRKRPENLDAYDLYLRALLLLHESTPESSAEAINLLERALALDFDFALAAALAAWAYEKQDTVWNPSANGI